MKKLYTQYYVQVAEDLLGNLIFYQALISEVKVHNVTALLSMEEIKSTVQLPLGDINFAGIR